MKYDCVDCGRETIIEVKDPIDHRTAGDYLKYIIKTKLENKCPECLVVDLIGDLEVDPLGDLGCGGESNET